MSTFSSFKENFLRYQYPFFLFLSFVVWVICFRDYIFGYEYFYSDAQSYQYTTKYFMESLSKGIYPLWDYANHKGVPFEFFLRRMGSFNPFYLIIIVFEVIGLPYHRAYHLFLALYYFVGMLGFYGLAKIVLRERIWAFLAFLFLYFSSWSTRLYDSYICLTLVPLLLFFYFFVAFFQQPSKKYFLGATFALMILLTTYLPFYFIVIFTIFLLVFALCYFSQVKKALRSLFEFIKGHKLFILFCVGCVILSLIPGGLMYKEGDKEGELILGTRGAEIHEALGGVEKAHMIEVGFETITSWGIEEDLMYSLAFTDMNYFKFAVVYFPIFAICIFILGLFGGIKHRSLFLFFLLLVVLIAFSHRLPIYEHLYEHIFFFKFFRNLHFFLWFFMMPVFCLLCVQQFKSIEFEKLERTGWLGKSTALLINTLCHVGIWIFLQDQGDIIIMNMFTLIMSYVFFSVIIFYPRILHNSILILSIFFCLTTIPALQVYSILMDNLPESYTKEHVKYLQTIGKRLYIGLPTMHKIKEDVDAKELTFSNIKPSHIHFGLRRFDKLKQHMSPELFERYSDYLFFMYDRVQYVPEAKISRQLLNQYMGRFENMALVHEDISLDQGFKNLTHKPQDRYSHFISDKSDEFMIKGFGPNHLTITTNYDHTKFFVYNDAYHSNWQVWIDGKKDHIYPANVAFKGVFIPAGEHTIHFRFGSIWRYALNYGLLVLFYGVFIYLVFLFSRKRNLM